MLESRLAKSSREVVVLCGVMGHMEGPEQVYLVCCSMEPVVDEVNHNKAHDVGPKRIIWELNKVDLAIQPDVGRDGRTTHNGLQAEIERALDEGACGVIEPDTIVLGVVAELEGDDFNEKEEVEVRDSDGDVVRDIARVFEVGVLRVDHVEHEQRISQRTVGRG